MGRSIAYGILIAFTAMTIAIAAARPDWISDQNAFLKSFIGQDILNLLGVILAITLASVASIHLEFNKIEERYQKRGLKNSRSNLRSSAFSLIALFVVAVMLVTTKPLVNNGPVSEGLINMGCMLILVWHILILIDLMHLVFAIVLSEAE